MKRSSRRRSSLRGVLDLLIPAIGITVFALALYLGYPLGIAAIAGTVVTVFLWLLRRAPLWEWPWIWWP